MKRNNLSDKIIEGYLIDKKGNVLGHGIYRVTKSGNQIRTESGFQYPKSWVRAKIGKNQKREYASFLRKIGIDGALFTFGKDYTIGSEWAAEQKRRIMSMTDDEIINADIEQKREQFYNGSDVREGRNKKMMQNKFYAFYPNNPVCEVAMFETKEKRDKWINDEDTFCRVPLTYNEVVDVLALDPEDAVRECDLLDDSIVWLINDEAS